MLIGASGVAAARGSGGHDGGNGGHATSSHHHHAIKCERSEQESGDYVRWFIDHAFLLVSAQAIVAQHLASFRDFSPRERPGTFGVKQAMEMLRLPPSSN